MNMDISVPKNYKIVEPREGIIYLYIKRIVDIVGSLIGLILLSPLFLVVALAIKIEVW